MLASLLFSVFAQSKRQAKKTDDISRLHQTYLALTLYENDNEGASPASLIRLSPIYLAWPLLKSDLDPRDEQSRAAWPANAWVSSRDLDGDNALLATPRLVSFAYLRPFSKRFPSGNTYEGYRNDPPRRIALGSGFGRVPEQWVPVLASFGRRAATSSLQPNGLLRHPHRRFTRYTDRPDLLRNIWTQL